MSKIHVDKDLCYLSMLSVTKFIQRRRWWMSVEHWWNEADRERKPSTRIKTCPSTTLTTTNPKWSGL